MAPPVLDDLELVFKRDAAWTRDVSAAKMELEKNWELFREELSALKMMVPVESVGLLKFELEVIEENKLLGEGLEALQKTIEDEKAARHGVEK